MDYVTASRLFYFNILQQSFCQKKKENKERKTNERVVSILFAATTGEGLKWIKEI